MNKILFFPLFVLFYFPVFTQTIDFEDYDPPSTLIVPGHEIRKAKYPFIDVHNHQFSMPDMDLSTLVDDMNKLNMQVMVNLSGRGRGSEEHLRGALNNVHDHYPSRFIVFTNIDFNNIDEPGWTEHAVRQLEEDVRMGANGLKVYKSLGMHNKDSKGNRVHIDDIRIAPVWEKCGELGIPILIHSADPKPFWSPHDNQNERWLELKLRPGRKRSDVDPVPWQTIIDEQHNVFRKHKNTLFINAHLGWLANDLESLGKLLDELPNVYTEIGAVIAELGRQPRFAKMFLTRYQDRVMFGKDAWNLEEYYTYFRVLESADEYFPYYKRYHAFWKMYGLDLSDEVLKKIYYKNALKVIPGIDKQLFEGME